MARAGRAFSVDVCWPLAVEEAGSWKSWRKEAEEVEGQEGEEELPRVSLRVVENAARVFLARSSVA